MKKVLDDGFVRLVDVMGNDAAIVQAARVSYGDGTKTVNEDQGLINYLMRNRHTSPFEMCEMKFHVRVPMDIWRQWIRHRTASVNEYSTRYSIAIGSKHTTEPHNWRSQAKNNKQGSGAYIDGDIGIDFTRSEELLHELSDKIYKERLDGGVAREQARKDLPLSTYTEAYWKIDLHNLLHFLKLRLNKHAQLEIREYAKAIAEMVKEKFPLTWEAFEEYVLYSVTFSRKEANFLAFYTENYIPYDMIDEKLEKQGFSSSERIEFIDKLENLPNC